MKRLVALLVGLVVVVAACGIPSDDKPREISQDAIPTPSKGLAGTTTSLSPPDISNRETIYLVGTGEPAASGSERLEAMVVDVPTPTDPSQIPQVTLQRLINLKPEELGQSGLVNALPADTQIISATLGADGVLDLDLSGLGNVESALQRLAVAQIVFTLTGLTTAQVHSVRFSIDGQPAAVPIEEGTSGAGQPVSRDDYPRLRDQVESTAPTPGSG